MKKPVQISALSLHIINSVRKIRYQLGLTQRDISRILYPESDNNLLGSIESSYRTNTYTDENLNKLSIAFSEIAQDQEINKRYTLFDFYPSEPLPEKLVEKVLVEIPEDLGPTGILNLLLEKNTTFFKSWHTVKEIVEFCNYETKSKYKSNDFTFIVVTAVKRNKLVRMSENEALYKKP